ncbi:MAG TPA: 4-hydroxy-tetrahydrodipicolinate synthase [Candidatus Dormibacteraeota bacterium]|nr:4-hydroxy-tetrahydrodipicolinate synthase [Candidatus Dormibacteraeota bacterium]
MPRPLGRLMTAMVTPFGSGGEVNHPAAAELARRLVAGGCDGVVVNGTTGESPTLHADERLSLLDTVRAALPDHAVVMGTGSYDTAASVALTREAQQRGADAALVVTPYYNKPPEEGLIAHYEAIADVGLPVVMYNIPSRCVINMPAALQLRLAQHPNIVGTKECADLEQVAQIVDGAPDDFRVWSGDDVATLPQLSVGAYGVISVAAHVCAPAMRRLVDAYVGGDVAHASALHRRLLPLFKALFMTANPIAVKAAVTMLGLDVGVPRLPLVPLDAERSARLRAVLEAAGDLVELPQPSAAAASA